jgi:hypothetical protein
LDVLETIFLILCIYVGFRLFFKFFGKSILQWLSKKAMQRIARKMGDPNGFGNFNSSSQPTHSPKKSVPKKKSKKVVGEYVDFEEID